MAKPKETKHAKLLPFAMKGRIEVGCDEAGRGCLAGPVVAAAVVLNPNKPIKGLDDSKKLSEKQRFILREEILEKAAHYAVGICSPTEIDEHNILRSSFLAMHKALDLIGPQFEHILIDGNRFIPYQDYAFTTVIKGDGKYQSIAAASILAKCYRDEYMEQIHADFPMYAWNKNKGYPTVDHRNAIREHGSCLHHRQSFQLLPVEQLSLFD